jgi:hypothetical protein
MYTKNNILHNYNEKNKSKTRRPNCGRENLYKIKKVQSLIFKTYINARQTSKTRIWFRQSIPILQGQFVFIGGCLLDRYHEWQYRLDEIINDKDRCDKKSRKGIKSWMKTPQNLTLKISIN